MVEDVIFRGSNLEIKTRIHDVVISSTRSINDSILEPGEPVDVFIYRLIVVDGDKIVVQNNKSLKEESVFI
ncbi:MAG: hypothetical protein ACI4QC_08855 [Thermoguttaceae bacterium]